MSRSQPNAEQQKLVCQTIVRCLQGDQEGYATLYEEFVGGVYRLCYSIVLNQEDAEDVTQESFVYAFKNLHRYDANKASFKTWLYTIAVSRSRNVLRKRHVPVIALSQLITQAIPAPRNEQPEAMSVRSDIQSTIQTALATLSEPLRTAVVLRYGMQMTYREIAEVMDCPPKTAESRVRLAHKKLRHVLQPEGVNMLQEVLGW